MINALDITDSDLTGRNIFIIRGSDPYLRDRALNLFKPFARVEDANKIGMAGVSGFVETRSLGTDGAVLIYNAEVFDLDEKLDKWFHQPQKKTIVLLVSVGKKMHTRYSRVVGRKGRNILCDLPFERQQDLRKWVMSFAAHRRVRLSSGLVSFLLENCPTLMDVSNEIEKFRTGWSGRAVTERIVEESMLDKSGGILNVVRGLFENSSKILEYAAISFNQGIDTSYFIEALLRQIRIRLRIKETGLPAIPAAQLINVDMRNARMYYKQANYAGLSRMWEMVRGLLEIQNTGVCKQAYVLQWLANEIIKFSGQSMYKY